jgi:hypothetical protein
VILGDNAMSFDLAQKEGDFLYGYPAKTWAFELSLGVQNVRPKLLDAATMLFKDRGLTWQYNKFVKANTAMIPERPGIYVFIAHVNATGIRHHDLILYVGKAGSSIRDRWNNYFKERDSLENEQRERVHWMLNIYKDRLTFAYCEMNGDEVLGCERELIKAFDPCCNQQKPKIQYAW